MVCKPTSNNKDSQLAVSLGIDIGSHSCLYPIASANCNCAQKAEQKAGANGHAHSARDVSRSIIRDEDTSWCNHFSSHFSLNVLRCIRESDSESYFDQQATSAPCLKLFETLFSYSA